MIEGGEFGAAFGGGVGGIHVGGHPLDNGFAVGFGDGNSVRVEGFTVGADAECV